MTTIRVVQPSSPPLSPTPWAPLNIRKASGASNQSNSRPLSQEHSFNAKGSRVAVPNLAQSQVNQHKPASKAPWWRRTSQIKETTGMRAASGASPGSEWADLDDRTSRRDQRMALNDHSFLTDPTFSLMIPQTPTKVKRESRLRRASRLKESSSSDLGLDGNAKPGFLKGLFQKKQKSVYNVDRNTSFHNHSGPADLIAVAAPEEEAQNGWNLLSRILRIKPECRVIVMNHNRAVARNMICQILLHEQSSGIGDLMRDAANRNSYMGRLDEENSK
jgi:hypothetical protein